MKQMCSYCDYHDPKTGWKEMNTPLLHFREKILGSDVDVVAIIEKGHLLLEGENESLDRLKINFCPICGRALE